MSHFIGYSKLEDLAEIVSILEPVFANLVSESDQGEHLRHERAIVQVAQPQGDSVHYVRIQVAAMDWMGDQPFNSDHKQRVERAQQAWEVVRTWLKAHGFIVREATVAYPHNYKMLQGKADFLGYEKERGYFLVEEAQNETPA